MPGKAILIVGYPGSGKTTYGNSLKNTIAAAEYIDDYHANAIDDSQAFTHGRKYREMVEGLQRGETRLASDREWCRPQRRRAAEAAIRAAVPDATIELHFIVSDETTCLERVRARGRESTTDELRMIDELSHEYHIPPGSKVVQE